MYYIGLCSCKGLNGCTFVHDLSSLLAIIHYDVCSPHLSNAIVSKRKLQLHSIVNHTINNSAGKALPQLLLCMVGFKSASDKTFFLFCFMYLFGAYFF